MTYKIGILDNDPFQLNLMELVLQDTLPELEDSFEYSFYSSSTDILTAFKKQPFDIVFLDIELDESITGIDVAAQLRELSPQLIVIFVTSHREYAFDAYNVEGDGYLSKPTTKDVLSYTLKKNVKKINFYRNEQSSATLSFLSNYAEKIIQQANIVYIERKFSQIFIHLDNGDKISTYTTLNKLQTQLEPFFLRINQATIVNTHFIESYKKNTLTLKTTESFTVGRAYNDSVRNFFKLKLELS